MLFVRPRDRERETWTGRRAGVEGAVTDYGAAMAYPIEELEQRLPKLIGERDQLYYALDRDEAFTQRVDALARSRRSWPAAHRHAGRPASSTRAQPVHEMRLHKSRGRARAHAARRRHLRRGARRRHARGARPAAGSTRSRR